MKATTRPTLGLVATLAILFTSLAATTIAAQQPTPKRQILAIGGRTFPGADSDRLLLKHLLSLTGKKAPLVYHLPTAGGDSPVGLVTWYEHMNELDCRPRHLRLFNNWRGLKDMEAKLLSADAIFVGGGNTMNMLAIWKAHGVDRILRKAWERGTVLAGESAGMICWFEQGVTDSRPDKLTALDGLGFLKGSACPHYSNDAPRRPRYHEMLLANEMKAGYACDDGVALYFEDDRFVRAVGDGKGKAYRVRRYEDKVVEEVVKVEVLKK